MSLKYGRPCDIVFPSSLSLSLYNLVSLHRFSAIAQVKGVYFVFVFTVAVKFLIGGLLLLFVPPTGWVGAAYFLLCNVCTAGAMCFWRVLVASVVDEYHYLFNRASSRSETGTDGFDDIEARSPSAAGASDNDFGRSARSASSPRVNSAPRSTAQNAVETASVVSLFWGLHAMLAKPIDSLAPVVGTWVFEKAGWTGDRMRGEVTAEALDAAYYLTLGLPVA